jgi:hypothetical protein
MFVAADALAIDLAEKIRAMGNECRLVAPDVFEFPMAAKAA